ncbi:MAG TPA: SDR family NAD(P)-dependent oxidoreductase [Spongiibacteraceae bacterium]|jgi:3-oxoacyl-[acyl-carrier protein] reductase|nr:SDR family NAD(P)-dependent oxidoreductase [Spongiibacteraceae bacterium]HUH37744.1 SDR family NAD(P)-dependent oxidoreductase [Spongiibacteraceae bacterium]
MRLDGKMALVTGAGQGIGRAVAQALAAEGAKVAVVDLQLKAAEATAAHLSGSGHVAYACDVSDSAAVAGVFKAAQQALGAIDILVNNAGIGQAPGDGAERYQTLLTERMSEISAGKTPSVFAEQTPYMEDRGWQTVIDVNLNGTFYCCREALRSMIEHERAGAIVNISSTSALSGEGGLHYCASKAGILGITRGLAEEFGPRGIRINAITPGPTDTPAMAGIPDAWRQSMAQRVPLNRLAQPEEIAKAVVFLASDEASYVQGATLYVNGGMVMS